MEKIRISSYTLAKEIWKELERKGVKKRENLAGFVDQNFTQEELDKVTSIAIFNCFEGLSGIKHLRNLKNLSIDSTQLSAYTPETALMCIKDRDIFEIETLENLEFLTINNQREITGLDISKFKNLMGLDITRCENLQEINGLIKNRTLEELRLFDLNSISKIADLDKFIIENPKLRELELDVLLYPSAIGHKKNYMHNQDASDKIEEMDSFGNVKWTESMRAKKITINNYRMKQMHEKSLDIVKKYCGNLSDLESVVAVNEYLARNVIYNEGALNSNMRAFSKDGLVRGPIHGANGSYDAIMNNNCVCEGYTRAMQYLLALQNINTANTHCIVGEDKLGLADSSQKDTFRPISLPKDGYHSICRVDRDSGIYYCDPCWNAGRYQKGDKSMPWLLLSKDEIAKTHTLSYNEQNISRQNSIPREVMDNAKKVVATKFEQAQEMGDN